MNYSHFAATLGKLIHLRLEPSQIFGSARVRGGCKRKDVAAGSINEGLDVSFAPCAWMFVRPPPVAVEQALSGVAFFWCSLFWSGGMLGVASNAPGTVVESVVCCCGQLVCYRFCCFGQSVRARMAVAEMPQQFVVNGVWKRQRWPICFCVVLICTSLPVI